MCVDWYILYLGLVVWQTDSDMFQIRDKQIFESSMLCNVEVGVTVD